MLWCILQVSLETGEKFPKVPIDAGHLLGRLPHLLEPGVVHRLEVAELEMVAGLNDAHRLRVRDLATIIDNEHAMIEFVANLSRLVESIDQFDQRLFQVLVPDLDSSQSLDEVEPGPGRVERSEDDGRGGLVSLQEDHEHVDEKTFVIRPAEYKISNQGQDKGTTIGRAGRQGQQAFEIRFGWKRTLRHIRFLDGRAGAVRGIYDLLAPGTKQADSTWSIGELTDVDDQFTPGSQGAQGCGRGHLSDGRAEQAELGRHT